MHRVLIRVALLVACGEPELDADASMPVVDAGPSTMEGWVQCTTDDFCDTYSGDACPALDPIPGTPCTSGRCSFCRDPSALDTQLEARCVGGVWTTGRAYCDPPELAPDAG